MGWVRLSSALAMRSLRKPSLAAQLVRVAWRFRRRGWYLRFPYLPIPDRTYLRWRMHTAYGDDGAIPPVTDVERYVRWSAEPW